LSKLPRINVPRINVPRITPSVVSTPANLAGRLDTIFAPRFAELERAQELQDRAIQGAAAAAGLGDSGVAIGAQQVAGEQFGRERTALIGQKAASQLDVEFQTLMQNAANRQAASLANAQINVQAQMANAQAILAGQTAQADNYLRAIGINAEIANVYRQSFLQYFTVEQQAEMQRDASSRAFNASLLDAMLKQAGLELQAQQSAQQLQLERDKLAAQPQSPVDVYNQQVAQGIFGSVAGGLATRQTLPRALPRTNFLTSPSQLANQFATATRSPALAQTSRIFGSAPRSLGIGGL